jgi:hypothetical protein
VLLVGFLRTGKADIQIIAVSMIVDAPSLARGIVYHRPQWRYWIKTMIPGQLTSMPCM